MTVVAGIDLGGTNITAVAVDESGAVLDRLRRTTPQEGPTAVVAAIADAVGALAPTPSAVGVGAPGPVDDGVVMTAPNLVGWAGPHDLAAALRTALGVPVAIDNDANVGTLGEWAGGAGRGATALLGVWVGTGVGAGLVLDGRVYRGAFGGAGELGHMVVQRDGARCGCGRRGCVEAYAGRAALEAAAEAAMGGGRRSALAEIRERLGRQRMTSAVWARALAEGDELARELLARAVDALGAGTASAINLVDCDTVVVGGGLAGRLGEDFVEQIAAVARPLVLVGAEERRFRLAALGDDAGAIGAAALARDALAG